MGRTGLITFVTAAALVVCTVACEARPPATPTLAAPQASADLTAIAKGFVELLTKKDYAAAASGFDATMSAALPPARLQELWESLITQAGSFKSQTGVRSEPNGEYQVVYVTCELEEAAIDIKVVFDSSKRIAGLFFAPAQPQVEYQAPPYVNLAAFHEQQVTVGSGEWALPGTLTLPQVAGPYPAVVLVHGSGPNDRDETVGAAKPFRDLAWGLASRGIAVLRYEKRTKQYADKLGRLKGDFTVKEEVIDDAIAAVALLRETEGIDPRKVFVLGHSLGGMLVPRIAQSDPQVAGVIVMAGPTRPLEDLMLEQTSYLLSLQSSASDNDRQQVEEIKRQVDKVKDPTLSSAYEDLLLGAPVSYWLDLRSYHPAEAAKELPQPMLILQGGRDYQVTSEDFDGWMTALSGRENVELTLYPQLNHLFVAGKGKSTPAEYQSPGHVAEVVVADIAAWIGTH